MVETDVSIGSSILTCDHIPSAVDSLIHLSKDSPVAVEIVCSLESGIKDLVDGVGPTEIGEESESVD